MNLNLASKKVLVIGASKGIGNSVCLSLLNEGCDVVGVARSVDILNDFKNLLPKNLSSKFKFYQSDVTKEPSLTASNLLNKFGSFDIVIHCVGTSLTSRNLLGTHAEWLDCININALHAIEMNSVFINDMINNKINGHILHVSSISALNLRGNPLYASSKLLLNGYITTAGREFAKNNIIINGVMPGAVSFENSYWDKLEKNNDPKVNDFLSRHQAIGRFGRTEEIADLITFLVSDKANFTSGCIMPIDGGSM